MLVLAFEVTCCRLYDKLLSSQSSRLVVLNRDLVSSGSSVEDVLDPDLIYDLEEKCSARRSPLLNRASRTYVDRLKAA